ncbi:MAG: YkvA family protein [Gemmatimonadota bacterium]
MPLPSMDQIKDMLESAEMKARVESKETLESIRAGFGPALEKVKDRLGDSWQDVRTIYEMAFDETFDMKKEVKYAAVGALAYLVSPVDLLPERYLGALGLADDVAVLVWALKYAQPEIERYRAHRAAPGGEGVAPSTGGGGGA